MPFARAFDYLDTEYFRQVAGFEQSGSFGCRHLLAGAGNEILLIDVTQHEQQFRILIEPGADAIEYGADMLAHAGRVRTIAVEFDFGGLWK